MDEREWLAERFQANRTTLRAVAYRRLGSVSEADDAVQEAWIQLLNLRRRVQASPRAELAEPRAPSRH